MSEPEALSALTAEEQAAMATINSRHAGRGERILAVAVERLAQENARLTLSRQQFEQGYAKRSGVTVEWLREVGREARPCDCDEPDCPGWQMAHVGPGSDWLRADEAEARCRELAVALKAADDTIDQVARRLEAMIGQRFPWGPEATQRATLLAQPWVQELLPQEKS